VVQDFRSAVRWIARRPGLAVVAVASLSLGIGANRAVFSIIEAFLFRPFPVSEPEQLVAVMSRISARPRVSGRLNERQCKLVCVVNPLVDLTEACSFEQRHDILCSELV
jgi:hypothetical protein